MLLLLFGFCSCSSSSALGRWLLVLRAVISTWFAVWQFSSSFFPSYPHSMSWMECVQYVFYFAKLQPKIVLLRCGCCFFVPSVVEAKSKNNIIHCRHHRFSADFDHFLIHFIMVIIIFMCIFRVRMSVQLHKSYSTSSECNKYIPDHFVCRKISVAFLWSSIWMLLFLLADFYFVSLLLFFLIRDFYCAFSMDLFSCFVTFFYWIIYCCVFFFSSFCCVWLIVFFQFIFFYFPSSII